MGQQVLVLALVGGVALALGWLSRFLYVVLLPGIALGVLAGALVGFFGLISPGWTPVVKRLSVLGAILLGFVVLLAMDDMHHRDAFRQHVAMAVYADSGADGSPLSDEEMEFFARGSDAILESNMNDSVGFSGPMARWLHRLDGGIRTFGSWERRRVIPVGRIPSMIFLFFDLCVSYWFGARVLARIRANREQDELDDGLKGHLPDLENERGDHEAPTG